MPTSYYLVTQGSRQERCDSVSRALAIASVITRRGDSAVSIFYVSPSGDAELISFIPSPHPARVAA